MANTTYTDDLTGRIVKLVACAKIFHTLGRADMVAKLEVELERAVDALDDWLHDDGLPPGTGIPQFPALLMD